MLRLSMLLLILSPLLMLVPFASPAQNKALLLEIEGPIGPATSDYVLSNLTKARQDDAKLVILRMNTPGGLDSAMRDIIQAILSSEIPVATYVAPAGARAASAGTYILYASHIAAMAPATNLGAATPVQIGGLPTPPEREEPEEKEADQETDTDQETEPTTEPKSAMERKLINDARAYIRSLAQLRNRNVEWAERAVTESASLTAREALEENVIDIVATSVADLLEQASGRVVQVATKERTLTTEGLTIETVTPDWRNRLLAVITNPQVAYILMMIGIYGLFFELANPGAIVPGVLGGICLLLALYAFQVLPVNYAGLALIILGLLFMVAEALVPSFGALGLGGVVAFVIGSLILWEENGTGYDVPVGLIAGFAIASAAVFIGLGTMFIRQRHRPIVSGKEELLSATGVVLEDFEGEGRVRVHGETWRARSDQPLDKGQPVQITDRDGLVLSVKPIEKGENNHDR